MDYMTLREASEKWGDFSSADQLLLRLMAVFPEL